MRVADVRYPDRRLSTGRRTRSGWLGRRKGEVIRSNRWELAEAEELGAEDFGGVGFDAEVLDVVI